MGLIKNAPFQNVVVGSKATLSLPIAPTYHFILLQLDALNKSDLKSIKVRINQKVIFETSGAVLDDINDYKGGASSADFLMIDFTEHQAKDIASELVGVLATGAGVTQLMLEIEIDAGAAAPTANDLVSWSFISRPLVMDMPLTNIHTLTKQTHNLNGANTWDIELPHGVASAHQIKRVWIKEASGAGSVTAVECRKNSLPILETTKAQNEFLQAHYEGTPATDIYCVDFVMTNHAIHELLQTQDAQDLRLKVTTDGAVTVDVYVESLANIALL